MTRRLTILLVLVAIVSGCDLVTDDAPATFEASYSGARSETTSGTLASSFGYTGQLRYIGIGTFDSYIVTLCETESIQGGVEGCDNNIKIYFNGIGRPYGTYQIGGRASVGASLTIDGFTYFFLAGMIDVVSERGRLTGSFQFTDGYIGYLKPGIRFEPDFPVDLTRVVMDGRFDVPLRD